MPWNCTVFDSTGKIKDASLLPDVGSLEFFNEVTLNDLFDSRAEVALPAEGVGINFSGDCTIEGFIAPSATAADNNNTPVTAGASYNVNGNIIMDRDLNNQEPGHILGISAGQLYLSVLNASQVGQTVVGTSDLRNGTLQHVAATRQSSTGLIELFVEGSREASVTGPTGSLAMPDSHVPLGTCGQSGTASCSNSDPFMVLGTEKHEFAANGFIGLVSQWHISSIRRYTGATYTVPLSAMIADANTLGLWNMAEQEGNTVEDQSGNGQTMILVPDANGPLWNSSNPYA